MTTGESVGYIVCEGITVPIERIDIRHGQIEFTASCQGPVPAVEGSPVAIFGSDGQGFCQGGLLSWDEARAGEQLVVVIRLSMDRINEPADA